MKKLKKLWKCCHVSLILVVVLSVIMGCTSIGVRGDVGSTKVTEASKKIGKKNSPAAIMTIRFSDKNVTNSGINVDNSDQILRNALENNCNFVLADKGEVYNAIRDGIVKQNKKRGGAKFDIGAKSISYHDDEKKFEISPLGYHNLGLRDPYRDYVNKSTKAKSFISAYIQVGQLSQDGLIKKWARTTLYLQNKKGEIIKRVDGVALTPPAAEVETEYDELIEKSIQLATSNFAYKSGLFDFNVIKKETLESVSSEIDPFPLLGIDVDNYFGLTLTKTTL